MKLEFRVHLRSTIEENQCSASFAHPRQENSREKPAVDKQLISPQNRSTTCCVKLQVHLVDFDDENNLINKNVFLHKEGEIWHISASPTDKNVLATIYNKSKHSRLIPFDLSAMC